MDRYVCKMAIEAREEGSFDHIAFLFEKVGEIEKHHEERYRKLLSNIEEGIVFSRTGIPFGNRKLRSYLNW